MYELSVEKNTNMNSIFPLVYEAVNENTLLTGSRQVSFYHYYLIQQWMFSIYLGSLLARV